MEFVSKIEDESSFQYLLRHHSKPIVDLKFNKDGDLLFTASKGQDVFLCDLEGSVLNVYNGFEGAITSISITADSKKLCAGSADQNFIVFDVETNKELLKEKVSSISRHVYFSPSGNELIITSDSSYNQKPSINIIDLRSGTTIWKHLPEFVAVSTILDYSEIKLVYSDVTGLITQIDRRNDKEVLKKEIHMTKINKLKPSYCGSFFITSSNDCSSKIVDFENLNIKKIFTSEEALNDSSIFPSNDKVVCVGGISARDAALSKGKTEFDVYFYDIVTQKMVGTYSPHFGTINSVDIHPSGKIFCSGGEDSVICLMKFDNDFYEGDFTNLDE